MRDNKIRVLGVEACSMTDVAAVLLAYTARRSSSLALYIVVPVLIHVLIH